MPQSTHAPLTRQPGSFRDPSGFVFERDGVLLRQVNGVYRDDYDHLVGSGLARSLIDEGAMVSHVEVDDPAGDASTAYRTIRPERIPFISYPYEWCFGQLRAAALHTLSIQRRAIDLGMSLKDASAYNVQFVGGRPVLIDTLSFEKLKEGHPWVAYRQFCQHFLAPLALMSLVDVRLNQLFRTNIDGVPLDLAARLLPWRSRLNPRLLIHLHLHARAQKSHAGTTREDRPPIVGRNQGFSTQALQGLIDSLEAAVRGLDWNPEGTEWANYYEETNYTDASTEQKVEIVGRFLDEVGPRVVWDLGANTGRYSRLAAARGASTVAFDVDPACVERNHRQVARDGESNVLPLLMNLTNPSPGLGWDHGERSSMIDRGPADLVMALALVHHLAISNNVPLPNVAECFRRMGRALIIEFVPKSDSQVQRLLSGRVDVFDDYTRDGFLRAFSRHFVVERSEPIAGSDRTLYLMRPRVG